MADPIPQYTHLVRALASAHPDLAYLHVIEPRAGLFDSKPHPQSLPERDANDFIRAIWGARPYVSADGYDVIYRIPSACPGKSLVCDCASPTAHALFTLS